MLSIISLFIQKMKNKHLGDGDYFMVIVELVFYVALFGIYRNT